MLVVWFGVVRSATAQPPSVKATPTKVARRDQLTAAGGPGDGVGGEALSTPGSGSPAAPGGPHDLAVGVTRGGERDILGSWAGTGREGAKYWLQVLTETREPGTEDVCIVVCDGLAGLPDAIEATWRRAITQTCVLHLLSVYRPSSPVLGSGA